MLVRMFACRPRFAAASQRIMRGAICALSLGVMLPHAGKAELSAQAEGEKSFHPISQAELTQAALSNPPLQIPEEAFKSGINGAGAALMKIDPRTGRVVRVLMYVKTGSPILDQAMVDTFSQWQFKPHTFIGVKISLAIAMSGPQIVTYEKTEKSMDDALASYLGKGTVLKAPIPEYPAYKQWTFKEGRGVYELHVESSGAVESVRILKSSGDKAFDRAATKTLRKWRLAHGPLVLELPLRFVLTPESYSVNIAR